MPTDGIPETAPPAEPVKPDDQRKGQVEAIKLLNDWSKWLITIELALIGLTGGLGVFGSVKMDPPWMHGVAVGFAIAGSVSLAVSILCACILLVSLPDILQQVYCIPGIPPSRDRLSDRWVIPVLLDIIWFFLAGRNRTAGNAKGHGPTAAEQAENQPEVPAPMENVFGMCDRDNGMSLNELLHGQLWCFLIGVVCNVISLAVVLICRVAQPLPIPGTPS